MTRKNRLTLLLYLPAVVVAVVVVRAVWLRYIHTLNESDLHTRVFNHSTGVALSLWALSFVLAALLARVAASLLSRTPPTRGVR